MPTRRVAVAALRIGMQVVSLDAPWYKTPFLRHRFVIRSAGDLERLKRHGIQHVTVKDVEGTETVASGQTPTPSPSAFLHAHGEAGRVHRRLADSVREVFAASMVTGRLDQEVALDASRELVIVTRSIHRSALLLCLHHGASSRDLADHAVSVCTLALMMGHAAGFTFTELHDLGTAAILHDIGLLEEQQSGGALHAGATAGEDSHPQRAAERLQRDGSYHPDVIRMVSEHHLRPGTHRSSERSVAGSPVLAVADRYDELLKESPVSLLHPHVALSRLYQEGIAHLLDPETVVRFVNLVGIYPLGTPVELNTGERGVVCDMATGKCLSPVVSVTHDEQGRRRDTPLLIDLADHSIGQPRRIVSVWKAEGSGLTLDKVLDVLAQSA